MFSSRTSMWVYWCTVAWLEETLLKIHTTAYGFHCSSYLLKTLFLSSSCFSLTSIKSSLQLVLSLLLSFLCQEVLSFSCSVSSNDDLSITGSHSCGTVLIEGTLRIQSNTYLSANRIEVATTVQLLVGTASNPVSDVTIYLNHQMGYHHVTYSGSDTDAGQLMSYGITKMYGTA